MTPSRALIALNAPQLRADRNRAASAARIITTAALALTLGALLAAAHLTIQSLPAILAESAARAAG